MASKSKNGGTKMIEKLLTKKLFTFLVMLTLIVSPVSALGGSWQDLGSVGGIWQDLGNLGEIWSDSGLGAVFGDTNLDTIPFSGVGTSDEPARWNQLSDKVVPRNSPDNTIVYANIYGECQDPDGPELITIVSSHARFELFTDNNDIRIRNLERDHTGRDNVVLECNGVRASFQLLIGSTLRANAGPDRTVDVNDFVTFDGSASTGDITKYEWNFGDGTPQQQGQTVVHQFTALNTYTVTLTVTDVTGATDSDSATIIANGRPTAALVCPAVAQVNQLVSLDATQSTDDGRITQFAFEFGDGQTSTGASSRVDHTYTQAGTFTTRVTVTDDDGNTHAATCSIRITELPGNQAPIANAGPDRTVDVNDLITFDGSASIDPDGVITKYEWDFGDGTAKEQGQVVRHQFTRLGTFTVTLTVTDNTGATGSDTAVIIANGRPTAVLVCPAKAQTGLPVKFDASQSTDDTIIVSYNFTFGDGTSVKGPNAIVEHAFKRSGAFTTTLTVTDDDSITHQTSCIVTVTGAAKETKTPRDRLIFSNVHFNEEIAHPGDIVELSITLANDGPKDLEDMRVTIYNYDLDLKSTSSNFDVDTNEHARRVFQIEIPKDARPGNYEIQMTASNDDMKHETFRTITIR
jgi:PKD repeat protein